MIRKWWPGLLIAAVAVGGLAALLPWLIRNATPLWSGKIRVVVTNESTTPIQNGRLWFRDGAVDVPAIPPAGSASVSFGPDSKGDLEFEFQRGIDDDYRLAHLMYLDYEDYGTVVLRVDNQGAVFCWYRTSLYADPSERSGISFAANTLRSRSPWPRDSRFWRIIDRDTERVSLFHAPAKGPRTAPVVLVEFADFASPACAQAVPILRELLAAYPTQVRLVFKHSPKNQDSWMAHEAALAAGDQGKFWEMHDLLFASPDQLTRPSLVAKAVQLGLNLRRFENDLDSRRFRPVVEADHAENPGETRSAYREPTPFFLANGHRLFTINATFTPKDGLADLRKVVDFMLKESAAPLPQ